MWVIIVIIAIVFIFFIIPKSDTYVDKKLAPLKKIDFDSLEIYDNDKLTSEMEVSQIVAIYYNKIVLNGHINDIFKITDVGSNGMYVIYACENQSNSKCVLSVNKLIKQVMIARCNTDITYIFS